MIQEILLGLQECQWSGQVKFKIVNSNTIVQAKEANPVGNLQT